MTEGLPWVVQAFGRQQEADCCEGEQACRHSPVDQKQGEELQRPFQKGYAPHIQRPISVANSKAERSNNEDIACNTEEGTWENLAELPMEARVAVMLHYHFFSFSQSGGVTRTSQGLAGM